MVVGWRKKTPRGGKLCNFKMRLGVREKEFDTQRRSNTASIRKSLRGFGRGGGCGGEGRKKGAEAEEEAIKYT